MSTNDDPVFEGLADLAQIAPDSEWESRLRVRCHAALADRSLQRHRAGNNLSKTILAAIPCAIVLCAYLALMVVEVVRLATHS